MFRLNKEVKSFITLRHFWTISLQKIGNF